MIDIERDFDVFTPNPGGQTGFMDDFDHRYCAFCGGWNAGKTWCGTRKTVSLHTHNAFDEETGQPNFVHSLIVAQNYQLAASVNIPKFQEALLEANISFRFRGDPKLFAFELPDFGTRERPNFIFVRSADAASAIAGFEVGTVYGDEVARWPYNLLDPLQDAWLQADGRLRHPKAKVKQFNMTYTPEGDNTRVYVDFELRPKKQHKLYRSHTSENIHGDPEFVDRLREQLSPVLAEQYLAGYAMSTSSGNVYAGYSEANVDGTLKLNKRLPLQLSIDFNIDPGMHGVVGQHDRTLDLLTAHYEIHRPRMNAQQLIGEFLKLLRTIDAAEGYKLDAPIEIFGDATGNNGWAATGESCWDIVQNALDAAGVSYSLRLPAKNPAVSDRVNAVNSAMYSVKGEIRYKAHDRCKLLRNDWEVLRWKNGEIDKRDRKVSHPSDADGYRVWFLMPIRKPEIVRSTNQAVFAGRKVTGYGR